MQDDQDSRAKGGAEENASPEGVRHGAPCDWPVTRRDFVKGAGAATGAAAVGISSFSPALAATHTAPIPRLKPTPLSMTINGEQRQLTLDPRTSLLDLLREDLKLTGTKKGCDHGQCGACTVLVGSGADVRRINSCLALAVSHDGDHVTTIEGLAKGEQLHSVQQAFLEHDGYQCGYCTPGQILSAVALLAEAQRGAASFVTDDLAKTGPVELTVEEVKERMSGNICRCGAYPGIVAAVRQVYGQGSATVGSPLEAEEVTLAAL